MRLLRAGLEPTTLGLLDPCSTNWATQAQRYLLAVVKGKKKKKTKQNKTKTKTKST